MGQPQGSPGRTLSTPPRHCVTQSSLLHALGADGTGSSPGLISLLTHLPLTGAHPPTLTSLYCWELVLWGAWEGS